MLHPKVLQFLHHLLCEGFGNLLPAGCQFPGGFPVVREQLSVLRSGFFEFFVQFQQRLKLRVIHGFHHLHDVPLQIHQPVNVGIDLCLHINDLRNHVLHAVHIAGMAYNIITHD